MGSCSSVEHNQYPTNNSEKQTNRYEKGLPKSLVKRIAFADEKSDHALNMMVQQARVIHTQQDIIDKLQQVANQQSCAMREIVQTLDNMKKESSIK